MGGRTRLLPADRSFVVFYLKIIGKGGHGEKKVLPAGYFFNEVSRSFELA